MGPGGPHSLHAALHKVSDFISCYQSLHFYRLTMRIIDQPRPLSYEVLYIYGRLSLRTVAIMDVKYSFINIHFVIQDTKIHSTYILLLTFNGVTFSLSAREFYGVK